MITLGGPLLGKRKNVPGDTHNKFAKGSLPENVQSRARRWLLQGKLANMRP